MVEPTRHLLCLVVPSVVVSAAILVGLGLLFSAAVATGANRAPTPTDSSRTLGVTVGPAGDAPAWADTTLRDPPPTPIPTPEPTPQPVDPEVIAEGVVAQVPRLIDATDPTHTLGFALVVDATHLVTTTAVGPPGTNVLVDLADSSRVGASVIRVDDDTGVVVLEVESGSDALQPLLQPPDRTAIDEVVVVASGPADRGGATFALTVNRGADRLDLVSDSPIPSGAVVVTAEGQLAALALEPTPLAASVHAIPVDAMLATATELLTDYQASSPNRRGNANTRLHRTRRVHDQQTGRHL